MLQQTMEGGLSLRTNSPGCPDDGIVRPSPHPNNLSVESMSGPQALPPEHSTPDGNIEVDGK